MKARTGVIAAAGAVIVVAVAYGGFWSIMARDVKARADAFVTGLTGKDIDAACTDMGVGGFPTDIALTCTALAATDTAHDRSFKAGAFRSTANILRLGHIESALEGPLSAKDADGSTLKADWGTLETNTVFWRQGLLSGALQATQLTATVAGPSLPAAVTLSVPVAEVRARQNKSNLDADFTLRSLAVKGAGPLAAAPVTDISGSATLNGMARLLSGRQRVPDHLLRGTSGRLKTLTASIGNGADVSVSGPFSFDDKGRLSGRFDLTIANLAAWQNAVNAALPGASAAISTATAMLTALGGANGKASITLTAREGHLSLGLIPIGTIPPV